MKLIRVFPRKTNATPDDDMVFFGEPPLFRPDADAVHVSCTFTYDRLLAEKLAKSWGRFWPVKIGGPAFGDSGNSFIPGRYLKLGNTITSRGCDRNCWFCYVPKREGKIQELEINPGWNIRDNNLLACSDAHINRVFNMLEIQDHPIIFSGGFEANKLKPWIVKRLMKLKLERIYFAYDTADDKEPLIEANKLLRSARNNWGHILSAYVLIGYPKDTFGKAEQRLEFCLSLGIFPYAMLYRDDIGITESSWRKFQRLWIRPKIVATKLRQFNVAERIRHNPDRNTDKVSGKEEK